MAGAGYGTKSGKIPAVKGERAAKPEPTKTVAASGKAPETPQWKQIQGEVDQREAKARSEWLGRERAAQDARNASQKQAMSEQIRENRGKPLITSNKPGTIMAIRTNADGMTRREPMQSLMAVKGVHLTKLTNDKGRTVHSLTDQVTGLKVADPDSKADGAAMLRAMASGKTIARIRAPMIEGRAPTRQEERAMRALGRFQSRALRESVERDIAASAKALATKRANKEAARASIAA